MNCPHCCSPEVVKNGSHPVGTPEFLSKGCGRQCVKLHKKQPISQATKELVGHLLLERIYLAGIACVTGARNGGCKDR